MRVAMCVEKSGNAGDETQCYIHHQTSCCVYAPMSARELLSVSVCPLSAYVYSSDRSCVPLTICVCPGMSRYPLECVFIRLIVRVCV